MTARTEAAGAGWAGVAEVGSTLGMRVTLFVALRMGRRAARALVRGIVFYFVVFHRRVRRVSRDYLARVGEETSFGAVYRHVLRFAEVALDRVFFLAGRTEGIAFSTNGQEHLERLSRERRGAILLGAHLGSFEAMNARSDDEALALNVLVDFRTTQRINALLAALGGHRRVRAIPIDASSMSFVLALRDAIERGELVAILGDRVRPGERSAEVSFLGGSARLPLGPYLLAAMLGCPVYLTFGLYRAPDRYELHCEPFAERVVAERATREADLAAYAQRYADRLEAYVRLAPDNWFNFYDFWEPG